MSTHKNLLTACLAAVFALGLAACSSSDSSAPADPTPPPPAADAGIEDVRSDAMAAAMAADTAAAAADAAVHAQDNNEAADPGSYAVAHNAAERARDAADAAQAASDAAAAATTTAAAQAQLDIAEAKQAEAEAERDNAVMYAGMVQTAQDAIDAEDQRVMDVAAARIAAQGSYEAAEADATKAEMQADDAEAAAPGSPGAIAAREAAMAARTAAVAAKAAHDAITDGMTKMEADAKAQEADDEAGKANAGYMTAKAENDDIQTTGSQIAENNRQQAVSDARRYGGMAADNAKSSADDARAAANAAKTASDNANDEYERAMSARTNAVKAKEEADKARAAYMAADAAANDAHTAYVAAKAAVDGVMDDSTLEDANTARDDAEDQEGIAAGHETTAMTQQMMAETAQGKATEYADTHVVGLLMMANAVHITSAADPNANPDETEIGLIEQNRLNHVANVNTAVHVTTGGPLTVRDPVLTAVDDQGGGTVTATYPYFSGLGADNALGGTGDNADTGPGEGKPAISVDPATGDAVALIHAALGADGEAGTDDDVMANFVLGPGLGAFSHEKYFGRNNDTDDDGVFDAGETRQRIILFTDIEQANAPADEITASVSNIAVTASRIDTLGTLVADTRNYETGEYDHDGNPNTATMTGTFTCTNPATCSITVQSGEVQSISGYTFTSLADEVIVAAVASEEDDTYLAFGVWLQETAVDGTNTYVFGAFADGGAAVGDTDEPDTSTLAAVTGDATYTGKAAGVHSTATEVEFFHGDATLNAKFGDDTAIGTITGMIHNIMSGGRSVSDNIELLVSDPGATDPAPNINADAGGFDFSGRARMTDTGMDDDSGEDIYRYTGDWSGTFYNHMANDTDTADIDESTRAPGSVAGTFGVGMADDAMTMDVDETESYVGAFGAHCSGSNCNPH